MSYAIVRVGGKQYRVEKGDSIVVDRLSANEGDKVDLEPLLFADGDKSVLDSGDLGRVKIQAVVTGHEKGKKIHGLKFKPKRGYKRRYGARADLTRIEIKDIKLLSRKPAARKEAVGRPSSTDLDSEQLAPQDRDLADRGGHEGDAAGASPERTRLVGGFLPSLRAARLLRVPDARLRVSASPR